MTTLWSRLEKDWRDNIGDEFDRSKMEKLEGFLRGEKADGRIIYPQDEEIFNALNLTAFENIKAVIIGQDPYHGKGQAHGLCFSVPKGVDIIPPSLKNIYKEIEREYGIEMPSRGDLTGWAEQGVLLLNATLTVRRAEPRSHEGEGWEKFTDAVIRAVSAKRDHVVFLLWGKDAQKKGALIDRNKHHKVLEASHPSPRSAWRTARPFIGCGHFKKANDALREGRIKTIEWQRI